jgi:DNA-binding transcriptional LysR family regulator
VNLSRVDLNLIVALDALLKEANVTRAAERVGIGQSAMSGSLSRLRRLFEDPLFIRRNNGLMPTPFAESLRDPVSELLVRFDKLVSDRPTFDPQTNERRFTLMASDHVTAVLLPPLITLLAQSAPRVQIHIVDRTDDTVRELMTGTVDLLIQPRELMLDNDLHTTDLFVDRWTCVVWSGNHVASQDRLAVSDYERMGHVVFSLGRQSRLGFAEQAVAAAGIERRVTASVENFHMIPQLIRGTDLVGLMPNAMLQAIPYSDIRAMVPPIDLPEITQAMCWHPLNDDDPALRWLRDQVVHVARLTGSGSISAGTIRASGPSRTGPGR